VFLAAVSTQVHLDRFEPGGTYHNMMQTGDYIVVDLRAPQIVRHGPVLVSHSKLLVVTFSPDFCTAFVHMWGGAVPKEVQVGG
jgi:hypothetical protein